MVIKVLRALLADQEGASAVIDYLWKLGQKVPVTINGEVVRP